MTFQVEDRELRPRGARMGRAGVKGTEKEIWV